MKSQVLQAMLAKTSPASSRVVEDSEPGVSISLLERLRKAFDVDWPEPRHFSGSDPVYYIDGLRICVNEAHDGFHMFIDQEPSVFIGERWTEITQRQFSRALHNALRLLKRGEELAEVAAQQPQLENYAPITLFAMTSGGALGYCVFKVTPFSLSIETLLNNQRLEYTFKVDKDGNLPLAVVDRLLAKETVAVKDVTLALQDNYLVFGVKERSAVGPVESLYMYLAALADYYEAVSAWISQYALVGKMSIPQAVNALQS